MIDDTSLDSNTSPCSTSIPIIRYAEILLTYAEAKCELDEFDETVWNETIKPLRERAGVDGTMPATADPYMIEYFLGTVTDNALLEIRRERGCELILENVRWDYALGYGQTGRTALVRRLCRRARQSIRYGRRREGRRLLRAQGARTPAGRHHLSRAGRRFLADRRRQWLHRVLHPHDAQVGR